MKWFTRIMLQSLFAIILPINFTYRRSIRKLSLIECGVLGIIQCWNKIWWGLQIFILFAVVLIIIIRFVVIMLRGILIFIIFSIILIVISFVLIFGFIFRSFFQLNFLFLTVLIHIWILIIVFSKIRLIDLSRWLGGRSALGSWNICRGAFTINSYYLMLFWNNWI
jgi:hypothetical protein